MILQLGSKLVDTETGEPLQWITVGNLHGDLYVDYNLCKIHTSQGVMDAPQNIPLVLGMELAVTEDNRIVGGKSDGVLFHC